MKFPGTVDGAKGVSERTVEVRAFARATRRIIPLLFACYIVAFLDRVNVGFAKLQMASALELSDAMYGFGAGVFFIGYFLFEVPSNLMLERVGARTWIARIMITWAVVSAAFAFVAEIPWGPLPAWFGLPAHEFSFYALRFLLGVAEAGFFPGIILYLTYWFPLTQRARTVALFMTAIAVANVVGAPISGAIMQYMDGAFGWAGWRWLFVLEAAPSLVAGVVVFMWLPDGPRSATWLSDAEREVILRRVAEDGLRLVAASGRSASSSKASVHGIRAAFADSRVWGSAYVYLTAAFALYGINFWMPTLVQEMGVNRTDYFRIGLITMIPWGLGGFAMLVVGAHSDRTQERRWHVTGGLFATAAGLALLAAAGHSPVISVVALCIATGGVMSVLATFWAIPTGFLRPTVAAAGIAWINAVGNLGGHFGPDLIGRIRTATNSSATAFVALALITASGAVATLWVTRGIKPRPLRAGEPDGTSAAPVV